MEKMDNDNIHYDKNISTTSSSESELNSGAIYAKYLSVLEKLLTNNIIDFISK